MASALFQKLLERVPKETDKKIYRSMTVAKQLNKLMRKHDISQTELAQMINESGDTVSSWLSGMYSFTIKDLVKIQVLVDRFSAPLYKKAHTQKITPKSKLFYNQQTFMGTVLNIVDTENLINISENEKAKILS